MFQRIGQLISTRHIYYKTIKIVLGDIAHLLNTQTSNEKTKKNVPSKRTIDISKKRNESYR